MIHTHARRLELGHELLERRRRRTRRALGGRSTASSREVERDDLVVRVAADAMDHVAAHLAQPDEAELHQMHLL